MARRLSWQIAGHAAVLLVVLGALAPRAAGAASVPTVAPNPVSGAAGDHVVLVTSGWAADSVITATVCGNRAQRGSVDCDNAGSAAVIQRGGAEARIGITLREPPSPCPCAIRLADRSGTVLAVPLDLAGAPVGEPRDDAPLPPAASVQAALEADDGAGLVEGVRRVLGGPRRLRLVLTIENARDVALDGVTVTAGLGRAGSAGGTLPSPEPLHIEPHASARVTIPIDVSAPVYGRYRVAGTVYAGRDAFDFEVSSSSFPWGLAVVAGIVVIDVLLLVSHRWALRPERGAQPVSAR